jgi:hypothetical protein
MRLTNRPHGVTAINQPVTDTSHDKHDHEKRLLARKPRQAQRRRLLLNGVAGAVAVLAILLVPSAALADPVHTVALAGSVGTVLDNIRNWIMGILAGLATVFLTIGGVRYVMAGGDPGEVQKAKIAFKSAGIGYGLAALAPLVVTVLKGIVGA